MCTRSVGLGGSSFLICHLSLLGYGARKLEERELEDTGNSKDRMVMGKRFWEKLEF